MGATATFNHRNTCNRCSIDITLVISDITIYVPNQKTAWAIERGELPAWPDVAKQAMSNSEIEKDRRMC
jgi:hypothetical protein